MQFGVKTSFRKPSGSHLISHDHPPCLAVGANRERSWNSSSDKIIATCTSIMTDSTTILSAESKIWRKKCTNMTS
ncbi:hypothetical protein DPMN_044314 [Dreissena polymorpha]|uniref:Uncharacterized protein n=1 Tax=Dreissena polymorpha TaxID=45954 RepID=A0A9D4D4D9_DREPO|nr:hypothetical protein DPMN_044314 [Dreissena polymorpha]